MIVAPFEDSERLTQSWVSFSRVFFGYSSEARPDRFRDGDSSQIPFLNVLTGSPFENTRARPMPANAERELWVADRFLTVSMGVDFLKALGIPITDIIPLTVTK